jgi:hypothetical protein
MPGNSNLKTFQLNNNNNNNNNKRLGEVLKKKCKNKVMHGQYIRNMDRQRISEEDTFFWLSKGDLKGENENEILATQDQALNKKYYATKNIVHRDG